MFFHTKFIETWFKSNNAWKGKEFQNLDKDQEFQAFN